MRKGKIIILLAVLSLITSTMACSIDWGTPTDLPPTVTPYPTYTPYPTLIPPTPTPDIIYGINKPFVVSGIDFILEETSLVKEVILGTKKSTPNPPYDRILMVRFYSNYAGDINEPCKWQGSKQVYSTWEYKGKIERKDWVICSSNKDGWVDFYFASHSDATNFSIGFPITGFEMPFDVPYMNRSGSDL